MAETALVVLAGFTLFAWLAFAIDAAVGYRHLVFLRRVHPPSGQQRSELPSLSIVFGARDEERAVGESVASMLRLDYPRLEVVAVNDRSSDGTGGVLEEMAGRDSRLRVLHVQELPDGWLGKNHALWRGAAESTGELLLFTDADVRFEPTVVARAAAWMQEQHVDHVAGAVDVEARGLALQLFVATFELLFTGWFRPWRAADPDSGAYVGFGGFNLVRREAYERAGTHAALPMDLLDDVNLGRAIKRAGGRQVCAIPGSMVRVEWYESLRAAIRGLEKNTMAGMNWSPWLLAAGLAGPLVMIAWPFLAPLLLDGPGRWLNLAVVATVVAVHAGMLRETSLPTWLPLLLPVGVVLVVWTYLRAAFLTYRSGGVEWRGTFYALDELRRQGNRPN